MTTSADVRAVWLASVFQNASILAITDKALDYEITERSELELSKGYFQTELNFFEYVITRSEESYLQIGGINSPQYRFLVEVRYTKQKDPQGQAFAEVIDALELLVTTVKLQLGDTWGGTVDFQENPTSIEAPQTAAINGTDCFRAVARFSALKQI